MLLNSTQLAHFQEESVAHAENSRRKEEEIMNLTSALRDAQDSALIMGSRAELIDNSSPTM